RFDWKGNLVSRLPAAGADGGPIPTIRIESGTLTLRQDGRPDSVFHGIDLTMAATDGTMTVTGTVEDEAWGKWTAEGLIPVSGTGSAWLTLRTVAAQKVGPELLRQVPFVNPSAWTHVGLSGITPAKLDLTYDPGTGRVHYRVALVPTQTEVDIASIGLHAGDAAGNLVAEQGVVTLSNVRGKSADGDVRLDSRMDFSGPDNDLRFRADLTNVDVRKLPPTWQFPSQVEGRLSGHLEFRIVIPARGRARYEASGRAVLTDAKYNGVRTEPVPFDFSYGAGGRFQFTERRSPTGPHEVRKPDDPAGRGPNPSARRGGIVSSVLKFAARVVKPPNAPPEERAYLHLNLAFRDVDLHELLKAAGVTVPVRLAGKVTVQVQVDVPTETPNDLKAYRMTGTVASKQVTIDELTVEAISAKLNLRNGMLEVNDFAGRLPGPPGDRGGGSFQARAEVDVGGSYPFRASVKLDTISLDHVEQLKNLMPVSFRLAGQATANAKLEGTLNPLTLRTSGESRVIKLRAGPIRVDNLKFRWESDSDKIRFRDTSAILFGGEVSGDLEIPFRESVAGTGTLKLQNLDLADLSKALVSGVDLRLEGKAGGAMNLRSPAAGEGESRGMKAEIELRSPALKVRGIPAKRLKGTLEYADGVAQYRLVAEALGGEVEISGQYPPDGKKAPAKKDPKPPPKKDGGLNLGQIKFRSLQLSQLWEVIGLKNTLGPLDADVSGDFPLTTDDDGRLVGSGRLRADRLRWRGSELAATAQAGIRLTSTEMTFDEVTFWVGEGNARARAVFHRTDPDRSWARLTLTNVPARRLLFLFPEIAAHVDLNVDGRLTTTMGREWRGAGVLTGARGTIYGIPVTEVRLPIDWVAVPGRGRSEVRVREATATAARGRATARLDVNTFSDLPPRLSGDVQFSNVNLSQAFRETGRVVGNLIASGRFEFAAEQFRGPDDLSGTLRATLGESQPFALPVFSALIPYLGLGRDSSTTIREGAVRAVLGKGVWKIERLTLSGSSIDLYANGTVTTAGRLNLAVTATSRERPGQAVVRRIIPSAALVAGPTQPLGQSTVADGLGLLGNYVVYLEVTGTIESPIVRLGTLRTLSEDAVRFFLFRFLTPA
ncbi:MAG TPA: hypothetical protein VKE40_19800, partial [Gemmataceae bacterium]|nr:hypothetical protein [Gemmataceae bacterium]